MTKQEQVKRWLEQLEKREQGLWDPENGTYVALGTATVLDAIEILADALKELDTLKEATTALVGFLDQYPHPLRTDISGYIEDCDVALGREIYPIPDQDATRENG